MVEKIKFAVALAVVCLSAISQAQKPLRVLDRTSEPLPIIVTSDLDLNDVCLVDDNPSRPAIIILNGSLKLGAGNRRRSPINAVPTDLGIDRFFDGKPLPELKINFSHHDFARAFIVAMGSVDVTVGTVNASTGVLVVAEPGGEPGRGSKVSVSNMLGHRFGVLASGQKGLTVDIKNAVAGIYSTANDEPPGHTFYANECRLGEKFLRCEDLTVKIGTSRVQLMEKSVRADNVTAKFKGAWNVKYECLDDENPCGALDQFDSSGVAMIKWKHPGDDALNPIFQAFRSGGGANFGLPPGRFQISGTFDCSRSPEKSVPSYRFESKLSSFKDATVIGSKGEEWEGTNSRGLTIIDNRG